MLILRAGFLALVMMLLCAACGSSNQALPTLAEIATDNPTTVATVTLANAVDNEPTPTREAAGGTVVTVTPVATVNPGAGSDFDPNALNPFDLQGAGFAADINGAETLRLQGTGGLRCGENNTFTLESSANSVPRLAFTFSRGITPGSYFLRDVIGEGVSVRPSLTLANGEIYDSQLDGVFVLKTFATSSGASITGDFEYAVVAVSDPTKSLLIRGAFNFPAAALTCS
jgi:hypothetical protein